MDLDLALFAAVFGIGVARFLYRAAVGREARMRRRLARRMRVAIASAREGIVRITGRVHFTGEPLKSPVSQRPCIAFHVVARMRDGKAAWTTVMELQGTRSFTLSDKSGQAVIDTDAGPVSMSLVPDRRGSSSSFQSESADLRIVRALLRSKDIETETVFGHERGVWFTEAVLLPETRVSVSGLCAREVTLDGERTGYRDVPQRLVLRGTAEEPLLISNWRESLDEPEAR